MKNYIAADIRRVIKKPSFILTLIGFSVLYLLMIFVLSGAGFDEAAYVSRTDTLWGFFPLIVGLSIFLSVYYDDFKSKSMQIAIGYGISRNKVILTKIVDAAILSMASGIISGALAFLLPPLLGLKLTEAQALSLCLGMLAEVLRILGYTSISAMLVYYSHNAVIGTITYVLLSSRTIMIILSLLLGQDFIVNTLGDVSQYLYSMILYNQKASYLESGHVGMILFAALVIYIALPLAASMLVLKKKELEF